MLDFFVVGVIMQTNALVVNTWFENRNCENILNYPKLEYAMCHEDQTQHVQLLCGRTFSERYWTDSK